MGIVFCSPEYIICHDLSESRDLFFIQGGDCVVNVRDVNFVPAQAVRMLTEGMVFGEIACVYDCKRTAEVVTRNYVVLARITNQRFKANIASAIPELVTFMKKHIYKYNYPFKTFLRDIFNRIPEMRFLNENKHVFNHILYKLERRNLDANQTLI